MVGRRRRWIAAAVGIVGLVALLLWQSQGPAPTADPRADDGEPDGTESAVEVEPSPRFALEEGPDETPPPPALPDPGSGEAPRVDPGFCREPGEDVVPYARPSLAQLLNERTDELVARARLVSAERGSETLRRGLTLLNQDRGVEAIETLAVAEDRRDGAFDFASAAAVAAGARVLARGGDPDRIVDAALATSPDDAIVHVLSAHVAFHRRDFPAAREALASAFAREPEEPIIALPLGRLAETTPDEDLALRALNVYTSAYPDDVEMARLAARVELRRDLASGFARLTRGGLTLRYHPSVSDDDARAALDTAYDVLVEAARLLGVRPRAELSIVIYENRSELRAVTCIPGWAGGVYDGSLRLTGTTVASDTERLRVVRHEGLHAALADAVGVAPYWFNEGLAQRFAHERSRAHEESWARIRRSGMVIPFPSLDGSFLDIHDPEDARLAYHQSLAMVNLLAARRGERIFADAVHYMREGGDRSELFTHLAGSRPIESADLVEFLRSE